MKAIIIEDVPASRENLKRDLAEFSPQVKIVGETATVKDAVKLIYEKSPDLIFLDIDLPDGDAFDILKKFHKPDFRIIFITGSEAHAMKAFRFSAVDYLLKPVDPVLLQEAVEKVTSPEATTLKLALLKELLSGPKLTRLALHTLEKIHIVKLGDIIRCEADMNYTHFYLQGKKTLLVTRTLKEFDEMLEGNGFLRVHQSHLVNQNHIVEFVKPDGGHLVMSDGAQVPVSSRRRAEVISALSR